MILYKVNQGVKKLKSRTAIVLSTLTLAVSGLGFSLAVPLTAHAATCTPTGYVKDSINLTAALINPGNVTGTVDATGCNIGVYYGPGSDATVNKADVFGANYYGIINNGGHVNIRNSSVHDIGETPLNGTQHGVGIYFAYGSSATGNIRNNQIWNYQKGGIVVNGAGSSSNITHNVVTGQGPVDYIAQNGIQIGFGAMGQVAHNKVTGNSYSGSNFASSGGILIFGGCGDPESTANVHDNTLIGNDVGVYSVNYDSTCTTVTPNVTKVKIVDNYIRYDAVNNTTGLCNGDASCGGQAIGYQAGVDDVGNTDKICGNDISGNGYKWQGEYDYTSTPPVFTQTGADSAVVRHVDAGDTFPTTNPQVCDQDHHGDRDHGKDKSHHDDRRDRDDRRHHHDRDYR